MCEKDKLQLYYRGSLNFCNYSCSYCPFSKKKWSERKIQQDKQQLEQFVQQVEKIGFLGAIQIIPYGEAMLHSYYWEAMAQLSAMQKIDYVGIQSNLSFPIEKFLSTLEKLDAKKEKFRIWGTFHPEMVTMEAFVEQCEKIRQAGIGVSVGMVGVPGQLQQVKRMREQLSEECYLWINKMDGAKRAYTEQEKEAFLAIDPYFERELQVLKADVTDCQGAYFVRADGSIQACPVSQNMIGDFYALKGMEDLLALQERRSCRKKYCNCYLAYNNRNSKRHIMFGEYPAFRFPYPSKIVVFDIDGTLLASDEKRITKEWKEELKKIAVSYPMYLATSRPIAEAKRVLGEAYSLFSGGVFSCGAHLLLLEQEDKGGKSICFEKVYTLQEEKLQAYLEPCLQQIRQQYVIKRYRKKGKLYKVTIVFWREEDAIASLPLVKNVEAAIGTVRIFREERHIEIVYAGATKEKGMEELLPIVKVKWKDLMFVGNSEEDKRLLQLVGNMVKVQKGKWIWNVQEE